MRIAGYPLVLLRNMKNALIKIFDLKKVSGCNLNTRRGGGRSWAVRYCESQLVAVLVVEVSRDDVAKVKPYLC